MPRKKVSSPRKRSTKAATQTPSTTSSTTAKKKVSPKKTTPKQKTEPLSIDEPVASQSRVNSAMFLRATESPTLLNEEFQYSYITLLSRGASPAVACSQLEILLADVIWTMEHEAGFQSMVIRVQELLSQNVAAALYRSAMEGSVSAQQNYLKAYPPPGCDATSDGPDAFSEIELSHEEIVTQLRAEAEAFLAEFDQIVSSEKSKDASR